MNSNVHNTGMYMKISFIIIILNSYEGTIMYCCGILSLFYVVCRINVPLMLCVKSHACVKSCCVSKPPCSVVSPFRAMYWCLLTCPVL